MGGDGFVWVWWRAWVLGGQEYKLILPSSLSVLTLSSRFLTASSGSTLPPIPPHHSALSPFTMISSPPHHSLATPPNLAPRPIRDRSAHPPPSPHSLLSRLSLPSLSLPSIPRRHDPLTSPPSRSLTRTLTIVSLRSVTCTAT